METVLTKQLWAIKWSTIYQTSQSNKHYHRSNITPTNEVKVGQILFMKIDFIIHQKLNLNTEFMGQAEITMWNSAPNLIFGLNFKHVWLENSNKLLSILKSIL